MAPTTQVPGLAPFIVTTSLAKPDAKTRKLIRSHVMRGKNAGKFKNSRDWPDSREGAEPTEKRPSVRPGARTELARADGRELESWTLVTPRKIASEIALLGLDEDMQPYVLDLIYRAFMVVKPAIYGLQDLAVANPDDDKLFCLTNFAQQPGILHSTLFAAQAFHDLATGRPFSTVAQVHLAKALRHLQRSLDDEKEAIAFSTMAVVASLALAAVIAGDLMTAAKHMDGLRRIVELRGGLNSLGPGSQIEHKARAIDLGLAMGLDQKLRFPQDDTISWSPQIARGRAPTRFPELADVFASHPRPDPRLLHVWADLREFSRLVNDAATRGTKVSVEMATGMARSVPYKLLRLKPDGEHGLLHPGVLLHELLRLCMLAYARMLLVKMRGIGRKMTALADGLRSTLGAWRDSLQLPHAWPGGLPLSGDAAGACKLLLWGLIVASVSIFEDPDPDEQWLAWMIREMVSALGLQTWADTRDVMKEFLWIDAVFDGPGEQLFQRCRLQGTAQLPPPGTL